MKRSDPLSQRAAHEYWIQRHRTESGSWRAVGFQGASPTVNDAFYSCRLRALRQVLTDQHIQLQGLRVLDVGCGLGDFSRFYFAEGAKVSGIDISPNAVEYCNSLGCGTFFQSSAGDVTAKLSTTFDLIHCFDVLYHITSEDEWLKTLDAFADLSHNRTIWLLTEFHVESRIHDASHVVKRSIREYKAALQKHDRDLIEEIPLYWLYSAWPALGNRFPSLIPKVEWLGRWTARALRQHVALWAVGRDDHERTQ